MKSYPEKVENFALKWQSFKGEDRDAFISLMRRVKRLSAAGAKIDNPNPFESIVMSILVEHQRELSELVDKYLAVKTKTCPRCNRTSSIDDFEKGYEFEGSLSILCQHCQEALFFRNINNK